MPPIPMHVSNKPIATLKSMVAIAAGKGGVGKSTVAVNVALALNELGYRVGVMDADLYGPSIRKMMPEQSMPERKEDILIPAISSGIKTISMAYFSHNNEAVIVRAPIANGYIDQFLNNVAWGELDILIIDFPPGTGDIQITLGQKAALTGAVLITTPQEVAVMDVRKAAQLFGKLEVPILGVVENMSYYTHPTTHQKSFLFGEGGGQALAQELAVPLLGEVPIDPEICANGDKGIHRVTQPFRGIAEVLISQIKNRQVKEELPSYQQVNEHTLALIWKDRVQHVQFSEIQRHCACAHCVDENTGKRISEFSAISRSVKVSRIRSVGHYGLQFKFDSGCSTGIYSYELLKQINTIDRN